VKLDLRKMRPIVFGDDGAKEIVFGELTVIVTKNQIEDIGNQTGMKPVNKFNDIKSIVEDIRSDLSEVKSMINEVMETDA